MNIKLIVLIILLTLFLVITLQNTQATEFKILFWEVNMSRIVFMYLSVLIGFIVGFLIAKLTGKKEISTE